MNPYAIIVALVIWIASLAGVGYWQNGAGHSAERVAWQAKDNVELAAANAKILQMETDARASEQAHAQTQSDISTDYERKLQDAQTQRQKDIAAARSGALRLRDPGASAQQSCGGSAGQDAASASGRDGAAEPGLSGPAAEFLLSEADRADAIVQQLGACQAVILADRAP